MQVEENQYLRTGDVVHFKYAGFKRFLKWPNKMKSGIFVTIKDVSLIATIIDRRVVLIDFRTFQNEFQYVSSSPLWKISPVKEILIRLYSDRYTNSDQFVGEILGAKDFESFESGDVLKYCIKNGWM